MGQFYETTIKSVQRENMFTNKPNWSRKEM